MLVQETTDLSWVPAALAHVERWAESPKTAPTLARCAGVTLALVVALVGVAALPALL